MKHTRYTPMRDTMPDRFMGREFGWRAKRSRLIRCFRCHAINGEIGIQNEFYLHPHLVRLAGDHDGLPRWGTSSRIRKGKGLRRANSGKPIVRPAEQGYTTGEATPIWLYCRSCGAGQRVDVVLT